MNFNVFTKKGSAKAIVISVVCLVVLVLGAFLMVKNAEDKPKPQSALEKAQEQAHNSDHYNDLTEEEKQDFDNKLKDVVEDRYFELLNDDEKEELIDRFVESEKVEKEIAQDPVDKDPVEIQQKISDLNNNLEDLKTKVEDLKTNGATQEEISEAEQQQQVEQQIKSAEQEKTYWETVSTAKDVSDNSSRMQLAGITIRKINSIFCSGGTYFINADCIDENTIGGNTYKSKHNRYIELTTNHPPTGEETWEEILGYISEGSIRPIQTCTNKNLDSHKQYFEQNKETMSTGIPKLMNKGYSFEVIDSWEQEGVSNPSFLLKAQNQSDERYILLTYNEAQEKYSYLSVEKACPEFWAQLEIEQSKDSGAEASSTKRDTVVDTNEATNMFNNVVSSLPVCS